MGIILATIVISGIYTIPPLFVTTSIAEPIPEENKNATSSVTGEEFYNFMMLSEKEKH